MSFIWSLRFLLLVLTGSKIGKGSIIQKVRFFGFGKLTVGTNTVINSGCYLDNRRGITIGNNVVMAHDTKIYTMGHEINDEYFKTKGSSVVIEDYVIVFSNVLIMPGVTIKRGAVILPGAVISKDVGPMEVVGGNPAKVVKIRTTLHVKKESYKYWFSI
ncbi:acyltransferase [Dyadobacter sp. 22481]